LSLMYLSSYLKAKNQKTNIIDKNVEIAAVKNLSSQHWYIKNLFSDIGEYKPDIIGITLFSRELKQIAELCELIKKEFKSVTIVLGGPHPTAMPQETLEQIQACDFVVRGEGEIPLYELIESLSHNRPLHKVKGLSFRTNTGQKFHHCSDAEIISDLDTLPFPDRESVIYNYKNKTYSSFVYGSPCDILMTSRGCPFHCHFCFKVCAKYRSRSPENVLREIDWIVDNISPSHIQIMDDSFTIQRERAIKILDGLIEKNYPIRFKVRSRVSAVDAELLRKMKQAGINTVVYGLESGSQYMLDCFNKRTSVEQNLAACRMTRKAGLSCLGDMILFYPGENRQTLKETEQFIKTARPTAVKFYVLTPLPQTKVYEEAKKNGSLVGDWGIGKETPWVKLKEFRNRREMEKIAKKMFIKTLLSPFRIFWILQFYGKSFIRNPSLALRMCFYSFWKKKRY